MKYHFAALLAGSSLFALAPSIAAAQPAPASPAPVDSSEDGGEEEIVVTGTFIRGVAPTGNQVLGVTEEDVQASGATNTNDLLATIPQLSMFGELAAVGLSGNTGTANINQNAAIQVQRPSLRNLPGGTNSTASSSPTLILMDGHRMVGAGVNQASPDAGVIPPGALERVEIITDGGSALYGTDAVGGVINFITRRRFDGVRVDARYGVGSDYDNLNLGLTAGTDWGSGSVFASITHNETDPVFGRDRDWYSGVNWNRLDPFGRFGVGEYRNCDVGNVQIGSTNYAILSPTSVGAANSFNACDITDYQTISPEQSTDSFFAGLTQELTPSVELSVRAFFTHRESLNYGGALVGNARIRGDVGNANYNPSYVQAPGNPLTTTQNVLFSFGPYTGAGGGNLGAEKLTDIETWGITPTITWDLGADWQLTAFANYGESEVFYRNRDVNTARMGDYANGGNVGSAVPGAYLNPYNLTATNPAVIADILNWQRYGYGHQTLTNYRAVFDGPLLTLPGGEVRGAFGAEYMKDEVERRQGTSNFGAESTIPLRGIERDVNAVFGELNIPIVGENNAIPLVNSLVLSLSARRDDYSDWGETTNPQVGLIWEPTDWLSLRANWGESFNAPSPIEVLGQTFAVAQVNPITFNYNGTNNASPPVTVTLPAPSAGQTSVAVEGAADDLRPQTGETWSVGFDAHAPFLPNLRASATYYHIEFNDRLGQPGIFNAGPNTYINFQPWILIRGVDGSGPGGVFTSQDIVTFLNSLNTVNAGDFPTLTCGAACDSAASNVYQMFDFRFRNFGASVDEGVDFNIRYSHELDWATLDFGISGNYRLNSESKTLPNAPFTEADLDRASRGRYTGNVGITMGDLYARATVQYSEGFQTTLVPYSATPIAPSTSLPTGPFQYKVEPFITTDLFFRYDLGDLGLADNLQVTLNVDNVFDEDPPIWRVTGQTGANNGTTLGRVISVGLVADF